MVSSHAIVRNNTKILCISPVMSCKDKALIKTEHMAVVLSLSIVTPFVGAEFPFHRGHSLRQLGISDICIIIHNISKIAVAK